ncbi:MAG: RAD55 family ATPase [Haloferacaceae archaeon]
MMYSVGDSLPVDDVSGGSNLLVSGPPMTGKYELMLQTLLGACKNLVVVSTKNSADRVREDAESAATDGQEIGIVDCVSHQRNLRGATEDDATKYVSSPENLTQIGVKFTVLFDRYFEGHPDQTTGVGLHSLSHLLMYSDVKQVYQFVQVLTGKIQSADWLGVTVVDSSIHDEQTLHMFQNLFDGVVETTRRDDGNRYLRVTGLTPQATDWFRF